MRDHEDDRGPGGEGPVAENSGATGGNPSDNDPQEATRASTLRSFTRLWPMLGRDRWWLLLVCVLSLVAACAETAAILLFGDLTDHALAAGSVSAFWGPAGAWLGVALAGAVVGYLGNSLAVWVGERFVRRLRALAFSHLQCLGPGFRQRHRAGDLVERLTGDVEAIEHLVVSGAVGAASSAVSAALFGVAALWIRWELALVTFLLAPLLWWATRRFSVRLGHLSREERRAEGALTSVVQEAVGHLELTQAYHRAEAEEHRLDREARTWLRVALRGARLSELYEQAVEVGETICVLAVIGCGAWEISAGRMTLGQLLSFTAFIGYLYPPVRSLGRLGLSLTQAGAGAERLLEVLDARPAVTERPDARPPARTHGVITFDQVGFRYPGTGGSALEQVSFTARPGEVLALTGPSGAGKSTLAGLLPRFHDPSAGRVLYDGVPLDTLPLAWLREHVTLLPQRTYILHATVHENIACGRPGASREDVVAAARAADAHDFVSALEEGYDTLLDPTTHRLSGGQSQRIAIARALVRDAPVLVLDEPTAGLDVLSARRVMEPLSRLMAGRTTLVVTHDLDLAARADFVLVLREGRVTEHGTPTELLAAGSDFALLRGSSPRPAETAAEHGPPEPKEEAGTPSPRR